MEQERSFRLRKHPMILKIIQEFRSLYLCADLGGSSPLPVGLRRRVSTWLSVNQHGGCLPLLVRCRPLHERFGSALLRLKAIVRSSATLAESHRYPAISQKRSPMSTGSKLALNPASRQRPQPASDCRSLPLSKAHSSGVGNWDRPRETERQKSS